MKNIFLLSAGPGYLNRDDRPYLFLLFSAIIHILVLWALTTLGGGSLKLFKIPVNPAMVEPLRIEVVDLPEDIKGISKMPDKVTALAQRTQEVEKEEYPARAGRVTSSPVQPFPAPSSPSVITLIDPGGKASGVDDDKKTAPQKESQDDGAGEEIKIEDDLISSVPSILRPVSSSREKAGESTGPGEGSVSLFPTQGSLQQIARAEKKAVESPKEGDGMTLLLNTAEFKYQQYFMNVKRRIEFYWEYPPLAARNGQQGRLAIDFVIRKDGTIDTEGIELIKSSNYPILDDAATTALRLASPFNPFPEGFDVKEITVHGSFEYSLHRRKR